MQKKLKIPFVKSIQDQCGQACTAMMIKYFKPDYNPDFQEMNEIIHYKQGTYSFPLQNAIILDHLGIKAHCFSSDDIKTQAEDPEQFKRWFGDDWDKVKKYVDIDAYDWMVTEGKKRNLFTVKKTSFDEILSFLEKDMLAAFPIDWNTFQGKKGPYEGHFLLLTGMIDDDTLLVHDPDEGPYRKYSNIQVQKAYEHPAIADDFFVAYGLKH